MAKRSEQLAEQLAKVLVDLIEQELSSEYDAALILHSNEIKLLLDIRDVVNSHAPLSGEALVNVRKGIRVLLDEGKFLSGGMMEFLARALDTAQRQDEWQRASAKSEYANAY